MRRVVHMLLAGACVFLGALVHAQTPAPQPSPCTAPAYRQFDFWLGDWEVTGAGGQVAGQSSITSILGGCALREIYTGAPPYRGESFNIFDSRTRRWHQSWVDNGGLLALFDGGLKDGSTVLQGEGTDQKGPFKSRMTFTPLADGRVRQHWERSGDDGITWTTMFDGYYARKR